MNKVYKKRILFITICILAVIIYGCIYLYSRGHYNICKVIYYTKEDKVEYGGVEYQVSAKIYTPDELKEEFKDELNGWDTYVEDDRMYIVVDKDYKRVAEATGNEKAEYLFIITSKYWHVGVEPDIEDLIQKKDYVSGSMLEIGESSSGYQVYSIVKCNHAKKVWKNVKNATVYFEMPDYEGSEYLRKIRVIN